MLFGVWFNSVVIMLFFSYRLMAGLCSGQFVSWLFVLPGVDCCLLVVICYGAGVPLFLWLCIV